MRFADECGITWVAKLIPQLLLVLLLAGGTHSKANGQAGEPNDQRDELFKTTNDLQEINTEELPPMVAKKCVPMLNFATYLHNNGKKNATDHDSSAPVSHAGPSSSPGGAPLSFDIGNIDMPIVTTGGSVHSAMKLISAFDGQFSGLDGDQEASTPEPADNVISFRRNKLHISGLNLSMLNIHLYPKSQPKFGLGLNIKNATLTGQFVYNGPSLMISGSKLAGNYRMSIDNFLVTSSSNLTKSLLASGSNSTDPSVGVLQRLATNDFKINISNLGYISIDILDASDASKPTSNYLLRVLQRVLQKTIKRTYYSFENYIRDTLELEGRRFLDCELTRFSPILSNASVSVGTSTSTGAEATSGDKNATDYINQSLQSDIERIVSNEIAKSQMDRVSLPNFEYQRNILGTNATIHFYNGSLEGLDHVRLNNETRVKLQDDHLLIDASVGWHDLRPHYNWSLYLGGAGPSSGNQNTSATISKPTSKGFVAFNLKTIDFDAVISKGLGPQTRITVDELLISRFDSPKMDIGGLPGMNRLARGLVNFFVGRLKSRVANSVQPELKKQLELSLNRLNLFK